MRNVFIKSISVFFALFFSGFLLANQSDNDEIWESNIVTSVAKSNGVRHLFQAGVFLSSDHKQMLYFTHFGLDDDLKCSFPKVRDDIHAQIEIWKFNNKNIKMVNRCSLSPTTGEVYFYAYALSDNGAEYIIKQFLESKKYVSVKNDSFNFNFTAVGFSKIWNGYGGDAL